MSYVQLNRMLPVESVSRIVSLPVAELALNVNVAEVVTVKPLVVLVQFMVSVHVEESTFTVQPGPPSVGLEPLSPEIVWFPLIETV